MKKNIEDKPTLPKKEEAKPPPKPVVVTVDKIINLDDVNSHIPEITMHWNKLKDEHPKLAIMYEDLNSMNIAAAHGGGLKISKEIEIFNLRKSIRNYEIMNGITRADHLRWSGY